MSQIWTRTASTVNTSKTCPSGPQAGELTISLGVRPGVWASGPRPGARGPGPSPGPEAREVTRSALHREETGDGPGPMGPGRLIIKVAPWTRTPGFRSAVGECTEQHYSTPLNKNATPGNHQMLGRKIVEWRSPYRWGCCPMRHVTRDPLGEVPRPSGPHEKDRPRPVWFC